MCPRTIAQILVVRRVRDNDMCNHSFSIVCPEMAVEAYPGGTHSRTDAAGLSGSLLQCCW